MATFDGNANNYNSASLTGTDGMDVFVFSQGHGVDAITNFQIGTDTIDLTAFAITWEQLRSSMWVMAGTDGDHVVIDLTQFGGGQIHLLGIESINDIREDSFDLPIVGGSGNDSLTGGSGHDTIYGGDGHDILKGENTPKAGFGNDYIDGGAGHDFIDGGRGADTLVGGTGADTFYYVKNSGHDTILDFRTGNDRIDLRDFNAVTSFSDISASQDGNNVVIDFSAHGGGTITLQDFDLDDLSENHFIFDDGS